MNGSKWRIAVALLALLALFAAACGSDSEDSTETEADATEEEAEEASEEATEGTATEEATEEAASEEATEEAAATEEAIEEPTAEVELFDSYEGVTADTIKIGAIAPDLDELRELGLVDINNGDVELIYDTFVDAINADGGVLGRQLELFFTWYNPVFTESADAACLELTQDHNVFAILGGITGPARDSVLCIVDTNETVLVGGTHNPVHLERAKAPWIAMDMGAERRTEATLGLYDAEGLIQGNIGIFDHGPEREPITEAVVIPALEDLGYEVTTHGTSEIPEGDEVALADYADVLAERLDQDNIETLFVVQSQINLGLPLIREAGYEGTILTIDTAQALDTLGSGDERDPTIYEGSYSPMGLSGDEALALDSSQECVATFNAANPDVEVKPPSEVPEGDPRWWNGMGAPCRYFVSFVQIAEAAGADLNPDTFLAAAEAMGKFELPGRPFNSLATGKLDADDGLRIGVFDASAGENGGLVPLGELEDIG